MTSNSNHNSPHNSRNTHHSYYVIPQLSFISYLRQNIFVDSEHPSTQHEIQNEEEEQNNPNNSQNEQNEEEMVINEKYKSAYTNRYKAFLMMGTNRPVKITDAKSGLLRRLIDVTPSGNKLPFAEYTSLMNEINFQLSGIAYHCLEVITMTMFQLIC